GGGGVGAGERGPPPPPYGPHSRLPLPGDGGHGPTRLQELHGPSTALLELVRGARGSHGPSVLRRADSADHSSLSIFLQILGSSNPGFLKRNFPARPGHLPDAAGVMRS